MTQEQYDKLKPMLDEKGINLTMVQLGWLDAELRTADSDTSLLIRMDKDSLYFDASEQQEIVRGMLHVIMRRNKDNGAAVLDETVKTVAGYTIAASTDVVSELENFIRFVLAAAKELGNEEGVRAHEAKELVLEVKPNKYKS